MQNTSPLQIGLIAAAIILVTIAIMIITGFLPGLRTSYSSTGKIVMWGFDETDVFSGVFHEFAQINKGASIKYIQVNRAGFEDKLLNAIASGDSPDLIVFPSDYLVKHKDKLSFAPVTIITEKDISQQYIDAAKVFLGPKNEVLGIPFFAEPLILFYNKDIFTENLITLPPSNWNDVLNMSAKITKKDDSGNILISGAALGRAQNIKNATSILTALLMQGGDTIFKPSGEIMLGDLPEGSKNTQLRPAESALLFFSDFANPVKTAQSWSAALPDSRDMFASGKLAMYFGTAKDFEIISKQNPHLNFTVATLPQLSANNVMVTSGTLYAAVVPKASKNPNSAWQLGKYLAGKKVLASIAKNKNDVSLRRDDLQSYSGDSVKSVYAASVLALKLWPNPDPDKSETILQALIEDVALGRGTIRESIDRAKAKFKQKN